MMLMMVVFWGLVIGGIVLAIRWVSGQPGERSPRAVDILREREDFQALVKIVENAWQAAKLAAKTKGTEEQKLANQQKVAGILRVCSTRHRLRRATNRRLPPRCRYRAGPSACFSMSQKPAASIVKPVSNGWRAR